MSIIKNATNPLGSVPGDLCRIICFLQIPDLSRDPVLFICPENSVAGPAALLSGIGKASGIQEKETVFHF